MMMMMTNLYSTNTISLILFGSLKQRVDMLLHSVTLSVSEAKQSLILLFNRKAVTADLILFGLTQLGLESTI